MPKPPGLDEANQAQMWLHKPLDQGTLLAAQAYALLALYEAVCALVLEVSRLRRKQA